MDFNAFYASLQTSLGTHIPQILGAIAILILGWIVAILARAGMRRVLHLMRVDNRIAESTGTRVSTESALASAVFWLVMLATVIAALNALDLTMLSNPFALMMSDIIGYLPHLLAGAVLCVIAWLVATVLRSAATRVLAMTSLDERLSAAAGMAPMSQRAGNVLFWLVILLFLPAILSAFRLHGVLGPVQIMFGEFLGILPNLFGAALIAFVGYVVARVLRALTTNLLAAAGLDSVNQRIGLDSSIRLSQLAGTIVFIVVFVPALIAALDAARIDAIARPATLMLQRMIEAVPHIIAATAIILVAWYVARFAARLIARLLESAGVDALPPKLGIEHALSGATRPSRLASMLVMFFAMLFAVVEAANQLGFTQVREVVTGFLRFAGDVVLGAVILTVGFWLANVAHAAIDKASGPHTKGLANIARIAILGLVIAMGLRAMGIANEIVQLAFALTLGAVAVAVALAFGLGGREAASKLTQHWVDQWRNRS